MPALVVLLFAAGLLFFGIQAIRSGLHNEHWLTAHGTRTDARLAAVSCAGQPVGRLTLAYGQCNAYGVFSFHTESGKSATARIYLTRQSALKVGDVVPIEYNPNNPANAQTADGQSQSSGAAFALGLVLAVTGGAMLVAGLVKVLRRLGDRRSTDDLEAGENSA